MVCWPMLARRFSKSSMSAIPVFAIEILRDVAAHRLLQRREARVVARALQISDLGLGKILIAAADRLGHADIVDVRRLANRRIDRGDQILEAARFSGSDVENAGDLGGFEHPSYDRYGIVHVYEVAALLAVRDAVAMRFEQLDRLARLRVVELLRDEAHHGPFVVFVGTEHVE